MQNRRKFNFKQWFCKQQISQLNFDLDAIKCSICKTPQNMAFVWEEIGKFLLSTQCFLFIWFPSDLFYTDIPQIRFLPFPPSKDSNLNLNFCNSIPFFYFILNRVSKSTRVSEFSHSRCLNAEKQLCCQLTCITYAGHVDDTCLYFFISLLTTFCDDDG